ncbi:MAG: N-acetylmuramoyl-L-alanine amidase [Rhodospirillum sp.]|nr:N-acetylmuramoyl-L-alanine amidase [Rhodospirillum sp.]MCF8488792.1 N-acetylmuramoyl-L-alanine amidase [Rhodospirillum sp.]MCF8502224.1 N-acetylmuramoyl-L-alanine amidase [Rhodospirillum sp.]
MDDRGNGAKVPRVAGPLEERIRDIPSPNRDERPQGRPIDTLVIHYTGMRSAEEAIQRLADPEAKVSAHYLIHEDGRILRMVPESDRAWHAGVSHWRGRGRLNDTSIGIELVNPGHEFGYRPFPQAQIDSLTLLCRDILKRHPIPARNVVGHADIAPTRKEDPGELFDWHALARAGVGLWPTRAMPALSAPEDRDNAALLLERIGYDVTDRTAAIVAFQRHFRPDRIDGRMDPETFGLLLALASEVTGP